MRIVIGILLVFAITGCEENMGLKKGETDNLLIGSWSYTEYKDTLTTLTRVSVLPDDDYGITFLEGGNLQEWKNVGWCGTPPVTYGEFEGNWEMANDSTLTVHTNYWGGDMIMTWHLIHIDNSSLSYWIDHTETVYSELE